MAHCTHCPPIRDPAVIGSAKGPARLNGARVDLLHLKVRPTARLGRRHVALFPSSRDACTRQANGSHGARASTGPPVATICGELSKWTTGSEPSRTAAAHMVCRYLPGAMDGLPQTSLRGLLLAGNPGRIRDTRRKDSPARLHPKGGSGGTMAPQYRARANAVEPAGRKVRADEKAVRRHFVGPATNSTRTRWKLEPARASTMSPPSRSPPGGVCFAPTTETRPTAQCDADDTPPRTERTANELTSFESSLHRHRQTAEYTIKNPALQAQFALTRPQSRNVNRGGFSGGLSRHAPMTYYIHYESESAFLLSGPLYVTLFKEEPR